MTSSENYEAKDTVKVDLPAQVPDVNTHKTIEKEGSKCIVVREKSFLVLDEDKGWRLSKSNLNYLGNNGNGTVKIVDNKTVVEVEKVNSYVGDSTDLSAKITELKNSSIIAEVGHKNDNTDIIEQLLDKNEVIAENNFSCSGEITEETHKAFTNSVFTADNVLNVNNNDKLNSNTLAVETKCFKFDIADLVDHQEELVSLLINEYKDTDKEHLEILAKKSAFPGKTQKIIKKMKHKKTASHKKNNSNKKSFSSKSIHGKLNDKFSKINTKTNEICRSLNKVGPRNATLSTDLIKKFKLKELKISLERLDINLDHYGIHKHNERTKIRVKCDNTRSPKQIDGVLKDKELRRSAFKKYVKNEIAEMNKKTKNTHKLPSSAVKDGSKSSIKSRPEVISGTENNLELGSNIENKELAIKLQKITKCSELYEMMIKHGVKTSFVPVHCRGIFELDSKSIEENNFSYCRIGAANKRKNSVIETERDNSNKFSSSRIDLSPKPVHTFSTKRFRHENCKENGIERYKKEKMLKKLSKHTFDGKKNNGRRGESLQKENSVKVENISTESQKILPLHLSNCKIIDTAFSDTSIEKVKKQLFVEKEVNGRLGPKNGEKKNFQKDVFLNKENEKKLGSNLKTGVEGSKEDKLHVNISKMQQSSADVYRITSSSNTKERCSIKKSDTDKENHKKMKGKITDTHPGFSEEKGGKVIGLKKPEGDSVSIQTSLERKNLDFNVSSISKNFEKQQSTLCTKSDKVRKETHKIKTKRFIVSTSLWGSSPSPKKINQDGSIEKHPHKEKNDTLMKRKSKKKHSRKHKLRLHSNSEVSSCKTFKHEIKDTKDHSLNTSKSVNNKQINVNSTVPLVDNDLQARLGCDIKEAPAEKAKPLGFKLHKCTCSSHCTTASHKSKQIHHKKKRNSKKAGNLNMVKNIVDQTNNCPLLFKPDELQTHSKQGKTIQSIEGEHQKINLENTLRPDKNSSLLGSKEDQNEKQRNLGICSTSRRNHLQSNSCCIN